MKILICGVGAIGSNLASNLVADLKGKHEITVLDKDTVETRNVSAGTQFYTPDQVGQPKVEALQFNLYKQFQREVDIRNCDIHGILAKEKRFDLIIDCFDNHDARNIIQTQFKDYTEVLHIGFSDQFTFAIEWADHYQVPTDITTGFDICEMEGARAFVATVAALGALVAEKWIDDKTKMEIIGGKYTHQIVK
jgi:saccharopine dehydrogenase-like NADP-dependent oxidoreductase